MLRDGKTYCQPQSHAAPGYLRWSVRQPGRAEAVANILRMQGADFDEMRTQPRREIARQHRHTILRALAVAHDDFAAREFDVLHAKAHTFHDAHARAVEQRADQPVRPLETNQNVRHLLSSEHDRQVRRRLCRLNAFQPGKLDRQDFPVQEQQRAARLVLRGRSDMARDREIGQKSLDFRRAHRRRMALAVKMDVASNPVDIRLLGPDAVMLQPDPLANLIDETCRMRDRIHRSAE